MGIVPVAVSDYLRFRLLADEPDPTLFLAGHFALTLVYASPYLLALMASRVKRPGTRGGLLAALGLLSFAASFSHMSPAHLVLLPATLVIWFAAARSLTTSIRPLSATTFAMIAGILIATMVGLSFFALFGPIDPEPRCCVLSLSADGEYLWKARPDLVDRGEIQTITLGGPDIRSSCVSDIITNTEAGASLGLLAAAFLAMILTMRHGSIRAPDSGRA